MTHPVSASVAPRLELIVATARNGVIGRDNALPWHLPRDLAFFKRVTLGHPVLMGRRTWESIGRPLPGRRNLVLTRDRSFAAPGGVVVHALDEAIAACRDADRLMVIGGAEIFSALLPVASVLHLTEIDAEIAGDVLFPRWDREEWAEEWQEYHPADERNAYPLRFCRFVRRR
jgi:dihydrofolate reductase